MAVLGDKGDLECNFSSFGKKGFKNTIKNSSDLVNSSDERAEHNLSFVFLFCFFVADIAYCRSLLLTFVRFCHPG